MILPLHKMSLHMNSLISSCFLIFVLLIQSLSNLQTSFPVEVSLKIDLHAMVYSHTVRTEEQPTEE